MPDTSWTSGVHSTVGRRHVRPPHWEDLVATLRVLSEATRDQPLAAARLRLELSAALEAALENWKRQNAPKKEPEANVPLWP